MTLVAPQASRIFRCITDFLNASHVERMFAIIAFRFGLQRRHTNTTTAITITTAVYRFILISFAEMAVATWIVAYYTLQAVWYLNW